MSRSVEIRKSAHDHDADLAHFDGANPPADRALGDPADDMTRASYPSIRAARNPSDTPINDGRTLIVDHPGEDVAVDPTERGSMSSSIVPGAPTKDGDAAGEPAADSRCGFIEGYSLLGRLGRGGMGVVYQAIQERLQRVVAIKVLKPVPGHEQESVARFNSEAMALARLHHPNIVAAYDYGEAEGKLYLVLEYVEGMNCAEAIEMHGAFSELRAVGIARDAVLGLSHALKEGIIHRDVKPANLILVAHPDQDASRGAFGTAVKVTDLGLARMGMDGAAVGSRDLTCEGMIVGTPCYMSSEQARGDVVDFRADIYGLGATLYHMVTGQKPFGGDGWMDVLEDKAKFEARLAHPRDIVPDLSDGIVRVLEKMLAPRATSRYASYEDLLTDLQLLLVDASPRTAAVLPEESPFLPEGRRKFSLRFLRRLSPRGRATPATYFPARPRSWIEICQSFATLAAAVLLGVLLGKWVLP